MKANRDAVQWHVLLDDTEWNTDRPMAALLRQRGVEPLHPEVERPPRTWRRAVLPILLVAGVALLAAGGWTWRRVQVGVQLLKNDLRQTVTLDTQFEHADATFLREDPRNAATETPAAPRRRALAFVDQNKAGDVSVHVRGIEMVGDRALVDVEVRDPRLALPYRETRFYRLVKGNWQQTGPSSAILGEPETLESEHFVFHFYSRERAAVLEAAPTLDTLYERLYSSVGMPWPAQRTTVQLLLEDAPDSFSFSTGSALRNEIPLTSPLFLRRPVELSDGQVIAEAVAVHVAFRVGTEFSLNAPRSWRAIQAGLRLWLLWELDGPLSQGKEELIRWMYPASSDQEPWRLVSGVPERYAELCQTYWFWRIRPYVLGIPLNCDNELQDLLRPNALSTKLYQLPIPSQYWELNGVNSRFSPGRTVSAATLFDYVAATYGHEAVAEMLLAFKRHHRWETLIPAVFGVSPATFEAGWSAYVAGLVRKSQAAVE